MLRRYDLASPFQLVYAPAAIMELRACSIRNFISVLSDHPFENSPYTSSHTLDRNDLVWFLLFTATKASTPRPRLDVSGAALLTCLESVYHGGLRCRRTSLVHSKVRLFVRLAINKIRFWIKQCDYRYSIGWILLVAYGAQITWTAIPRRRAFVTAGIALLLIVGCCRTIARNRDWTSRETLLKYVFSRWK